MLDGGRALTVSAQARALGAQPGMRAGGILALAPGAIVLDRDPQREQDLLNAAVLALYRFTPEIAHEDGGLLLDVGASLTLFGGAARLSRLVHSCLAALGLRAVIGAAPTAAGAWLLARRPRTTQRPLVRRCLVLERLQRELDTMPCAVLPAAQPHHAWLSGVGAQTLGALRRLPRAGLIRRTSTQLADALDRAYGDRVEMFRWLTIPATFAAHIETHERVEHADALFDGASSLILQMTGWLTAVHLAVSSITLSLEHERGRTAIEPTVIEITLAEAVWKPDHLLRMLRERLAKTELAAPVIGLRLEAGRLVDLVPSNGSLFPEPGGSPADLLRLTELLAARLGPDNVLAPAAAADHRPEVCNAWRPAAAKLSKLPDDEEDLQRPFWLLKQPIKLLMRDDRPYYGSPLTLIRGPERIEAGWWNDDTAARDYYIGQGKDAACYWIFQERGGDMQWFLHGLFA